jgi:hypothetical protein
VAAVIAVQQEQRCERSGDAEIERVTGHVGSIRLGIFCGDPGEEFIAATISAFASSTRPLHFDTGS